MSISVRIPLVPIILADIAKLDPETTSEDKLIAVLELMLERLKEGV